MRKRVDLSLLLIISYFVVKVIYTSLSGFLIAVLLAPAF